MGLATSFAMGNMACTKDDLGIPDTMFVLDEKLVSSIVANSPSDQSGDYAREVITAEADVNNVFGTINVSLCSDSLCDVVIRLIWRAIGKKALRIT